MKIVKEFKDFAMRGNVMDMAVGVILGASFGKIVTSLVNDIIMPPIGMLLGSVDFSHLAITLQTGMLDVAPVTIRYGAFINTVLDFVIVGFAIFMVVKQLNRFKKEADPSTMECPKCISKISVKASRCPHCTSDL